MYYWLRAKGIYLYIVSDRSLVDPIVPRTTVFEKRVPWHYETLLVDHGSFDGWEGGKRNVWAPYPNQDCVRLHENSKERGTVLEILPASKKKISGILFKHQTEDYFKGGFVNAQVDALCHEPGKFDLSVGLMAKEKDKKPVLFKGVHPGDGRWHTVSVDLQIPQDVDFRFIRIDARLKGGSASSAKIANAAAKFWK